VVHAAAIQDRDGAKLVLETLVGRFPRLKRILADGISNGAIAAWAKEVGGGCWSWSSTPRGRRNSRSCRSAGSSSGCSPGGGATAG
jgi:hypothetical protein